MSWSRKLALLPRMRMAPLEVAILVMGATNCAPELPPLEGGETSEGSLGESTGSSGGIEPTASNGDPGNETSTTTEGTSTTEMTGTSTTTEGTSTTTIGPVAVCGNGDIEEGEECDGTDWNGATCESLMQAPGSLGCTEGCAFDLTGCVPPGMLLVPGGVFEMGSADSPEYPVRQVQVDAFWIDETEVTVQAYAACVDDDACSEPSTETYCNWMEAGREDHPVNCVTWDQAEAYCGWADGDTKRLPTEAEW